VVAEGEEAGVVEEEEKAGLRQDQEAHVYAPNAVIQHLTPSVHLATNNPVPDAEPQ
jgi:hypothetical protein